MDLKDATLMLLAESAAHPALAGAAQSAYDALASGPQVQYQIGPQVPIPDAE